MEAALLSDYPNGLIGTTVEGRYRVDSVLAQGGMGTVFHATHLTLNRPVALKILRPDLESDQTQRFLREANIVAQLEHRNCVTVFDHGRSAEGYHFMTMQLLKGHPLSRDTGEPMDPIRACSIIADVMRGLEHAHSRNVVHRDLKPENLFVTVDEDQRECIKLLDFGIAKQMQPSDSSEGAVTLSGLMAGTPAYMSPEQVIGADTDERTDLYSAGVIFYELLAGHTPFNTDDPVVLLHHQLNEEFPPLPDSVPEELHEIVRVMCNKEKSKRYPSTSAVLEDLEGFLVDATDGAIAASSSSTRRWATDPRRASSGGLRKQDTIADMRVMTDDDTVPGRPWWHWGVAAGLLLLAGGVAVPMLTSDGGNTDDIEAAISVNSATPEAAPMAGATESDHSGFVSLLAKVNDPERPLPYEARRQSLQALEGSAYASKVHAPLQTGLDLVQAQESPTACATFRDSLSEIEKSQDAFYVPYIKAAEVPEPGASEAAADCEGLNEMLDQARRRIKPGEVAEPEKEERVAAVRRSSKRRVARKKSRKPLESEPTPTEAPASDPAPTAAAAEPQPDAAPERPKLPKPGTHKIDRSSKPKKKSDGVTKLRTGLRDL